MTVTEYDVQQAIKNIKEKDTVSHFTRMCLESISPDLHTILIEKILPGLRSNRQAFK